MTDLKAVFQWMSSHETGMSSKAIAMHMMSGWSDGSYPRDPADLNRCVKLLDRFPEWRGRIGEMTAYGKTWAAYASRWDEMELLLRREISQNTTRAPRTYKLMQKIRGEEA